MVLFKRMTSVINGERLATGGCYPPPRTESGRYVSLRMGLSLTRSSDNFSPSVPSGRCTIPIGKAFYRRRAAVGSTTWSPTGFRARKERGARGKVARRRTLLTGPCSRWHRNLMRSCTMTIVGGQSWVGLWVAAQLARCGLILSLEAQVRRRSTVRWSSVLDHVSETAWRCDKRQAHNWIADALACRPRGAMLTLRPGSL